MTETVRFYHRHFLAGSLGSIVKSNNRYLSLPLEHRTDGYRTFVRKFRNPRSLKAVFGRRVFKWRPRRVRRERVNYTYPYIHSIRAKR